MSVTLYGPSLALSQVTGLHSKSSRRVNIHIYIFCVSFPSLACCFIMRNNLYILYKYCKSYPRTKRSRTKSHHTAVYETAFST